jgi:hypothetical protein
MKAEAKTWLDESDEVRSWIDSVGNGTAKIYAPRFDAIMDHITASGEFKGFTPSMLLDFQDRATGRDRVNIINRLNQYCKQLSRRFRPKTVDGYYTAARSFFSYHGVDLPRRRYKLDDDYIEPKNQDLDRESLIKILGAAKPRDKAIYTIAFQSGLGFREFDELNHKSDEITAQLDEGVRFVTIQLSDRKELRGKRQGYFTLIGGDGLRLLREYLKVRGRPRGSEPLFIRGNAGRGENDDPALSARSYHANFVKLAKRVGLEGVYYPHQVRDALRTEWQRSGADTLVCEFIMGHNVDPNKYLKFLKIPDYVIGQFEKALEYLNLISNPDKTRMEDQLEKITSDLERRNEEYDTVFKLFDEYTEKLDATSTLLGKLLTGEITPEKVQKETLEKLKVTPAK